MNTTLIHSAQIVNEGQIYTGYVLIADTHIQAVGHGDPADEIFAQAQTTVDAHGKLLLPGIIDTHVHFRDPGLTHKGDIATESRAAVAGGVTSYLDMPNTKPPTVTLEAWQQKMDHAAKTSLANYGFFIGATSTNIDQLRQADYTRIPGVKLFMGSSTGGMLLDDPAVLESIFTQIPALIAVHAEDEATLRANRQAVVERYGEDLDMEFHPVIRNHRACALASVRAVQTARRLHHRLHLLHVSTGAELELLEPGPPQGKLITAETCPQYLAFSHEQYPMLGTRIKCNPAIKTPADRDALRQAIISGLIDTIATDHAPHLLSEKQGTALTAASGMPMVQFSLTLMLQMVAEDILSLTDLVSHMCHNPATIYGINKRGFIRPGYYADLVLVDHDCEPYTITDAWAISRCGWTPLSGLTVANRVLTTWVNGTAAYRHGVVFQTPASMPLEFTPPII